jgi:hypothetical protein
VAQEVLSSGCTLGISIGGPPWGHIYRDLIEGVTEPTVCIIVAVGLSIRVMVPTEQWVVWSPIRNG